MTRWSAFNKGQPATPSVIQASGRYWIGLIDPGGQTPTLNDSIIQLVLFYDFIAGARSMGGVILAITVAITASGQASVQERSSSDSSTKQDLTNVCGQLSLFAIAKYVGHPVTLEDVFALLPANGRRLAMSKLQAAAEDLGLSTKALLWRHGHAAIPDCPAIIRVESSTDSASGHFVVLASVHGGNVLIIDGVKAPRWLSLEHLWKSWDGVAIYVHSSTARLPHGFGDGLWTIAGLCVLLGGRDTLAVEPTNRHPGRT